MELKCWWCNVSSGRVEDVTVRQKVVILVLQVFRELQFSASLKIKHGQMMYFYFKR